MTKGVSENDSEVQFTELWILSSVRCVFRLFRCVFRLFRCVFRLFRCVFRLFSSGSILHLYYRYLAPSSSQPTWNYRSSLSTIIPIFTTINGAQKSCL